MENKRMVELSEESWEVINTISEFLLTNEVIDDLLLYLASLIASKDENIKRQYICVDLVLIARRKEKYLKEKL